MMKEISLRNYGHFAEKITIEFQYLDESQKHVRTSKQATYLFQQNYLTLPLQVFKFYGDHLPSLLVKISQVQVRDY